MVDTWLPFCIKTPGPATKQGYPGVASTPLSEKEGEVKHSMEGTFAGALAVLRNLSIQSSWHFSVPKVGQPHQHYPLEALTWHAGLPGDRRTDTSLMGNLTLIGEEHEDYPDNKLNANQVHWTIKISKAIRGLCPRVAARPPLRRVNLWEHNEVSPTSCPSKLFGDYPEPGDPWTEIITALQEDEMAKNIRLPNGAMWSTDGIFARDMNTPGTAPTAIKLWGEPIAVSQEYADRLIPASQLVTDADLTRIVKAVLASIPTGSGITFQQAVDAAKKALKEGGG